jgi:hemolysin activation/secretion protein
MMKAFALFFCLLTMIVAPSLAQAQTAPLIIDTNRPDRSPAAAAPTPAPPAGAGRVEAAAAAASTSFILRDVHIQGSSLSPAALSPAWRAYVGKSVDNETLGKIADAVGEAYSHSDIALYTVLLPRQSFEGGVARLRVVEGYVAEIAIKAPEGVDVRLTKAYAEKLKSHRPLRRPTLERTASLIQDIPGQTAEFGLLQAGAPGAVRLAITIKPKPFDAAVSVNNRGSDYLGRTQVEASITANALLHEGDQTRLTVAFPTEFKRFQYVSLTHSEPIADTGATASLTVGRLHTQPKIAGFDLSGNATTAGALVSYPLIRSNKRNLFLSGGLDGLNSDNALFGRQFSSERTRALRLAGSYSLTAPKHALSLSLTVSQGIDGLGARMADPRFSKAAFLKTNVQGGYNQQVGKSWVVRLAAGAQYTTDPLPSSEQYALGGSQFGRAFSSAVITGSSGYAGSAELAWRPTVNIPKRLSGSELYAFADEGKVTHDFGPIRNQTLASCGGGVRLALLSKGVVELEAAKAVKNPIPGAGSPWRLMVNFRSTF